MKTKSPKRAESLRLIHKSGDDNPLRLNLRAIAGQPKTTSLMTQNRVWLLTDRPKTDWHAPNGRYLN